MLAVNPSARCGVEEALADPYLVDAPVVCEYDIALLHAPQRVDESLFDFERREYMLESLKDMIRLEVAQVHESMVDSQSNDSMSPATDGDPAEDENHVPPSATVPAYIGPAGVERAKSASVPNRISRSSITNADGRLFDPSVTPSTARRFIPDNTGNTVRAAVQQALTTTGIEAFKEEQPAITEGSSTVNQTKPSSAKIFKRSDSAIESSVCSRSSSSSHITSLSEKQKALTSAKGVASKTRPGGKYKKDDDVNCVAQHLPTVSSEKTRENGTVDERSYASVNRVQSDIERTDSDSIVHVESDAASSISGCKEGVNGTADSRQKINRFPRQLPAMKNSRIGQSQLGEAKDHRPTTIAPAGSTAATPAGPNLLVAPRRRGGAFSILDKLTKRNTGTSHNKQATHHLPRVGVVTRTAPTESPKNGRRAR
jgi:hypothetical protein